MKHKLISVGLAVMLVLSFGLITTVPVAAQPLRPELATVANGISEWSTDYARSGTYSIRFHAVNWGVDAFAAGVPVDAPIPLNGITQLSYWRNGVGFPGAMDYAPPSVLLCIDANSDGKLDFDTNGALLAAHLWDTSALGDDAIFGIGADWIVTETGWLEVNGLTNSYWQYGGVFWADKTGVYADWVTYTSLQDFPGAGPIDPTDSVMLVALAGGNPDGDVYIDDILINGALYDFEPTLDLDKDWYRTGEMVEVTVEDAAQADWVKIQAVSDYDTVGVIVTLTETGSGTGVFEGSFQLSEPPVRPLPPPQALMVENDDLITVTYLEVTDTARVDDIPPEITIDPVTSPTNNPLQTISGTFTELNLDAIQLTVKGMPQNLKVEELVGTWTTFSAVTLMEGDNPIVATITDLIGNETTAEANIILDTQAPGVGIDLPDYINIANEGAVPVTIISDEDGDYRVAVSDGTLAVGASGVIYGDEPVNILLDASPLAEGPINASVDVTDWVGNVGQASDGAIKDTVTPGSLSYLSITSPVNSLNQDEVSISGMGEPLATVSGYICDQHGLTVEVAGSVDVKGSLYIFPIDVTSLGDGNLEAGFSLTDDAGNTGGLATVTTYKDATLPTVEITSEAPDPTNTSPIEMAATFSEDVVGFEKGDITVQNGTVQRFAGTDAAHYLFTVIPDADGEVEVNIADGVATDRVGNPNSAADFSIIYDTTNPEVKVLSPNGGENWLGGSTHDITWTAADANFGGTPITLEYSLNAGNNWELIAANIENTGTYSWTLPNLSSGYCLVRVTAVDLAGNVGSDDSNYIFTMYSDITAPAVTVNSPNGGEVWQAGSTQTITWTATDDKTPSGSLLIDLYYSSNGGTDWESIASIGANNGAYSWLVPDINSSQCLVKVGATDASGIIGADVSDRVFTITTPEEPAAPIVTIELKAGWNLVSLMLVPTSSNITDVLGDIPVLSVWAYDASIENLPDRWSSYTPGPAPGDLEEMVDGKGYWIEMSAPAVLIIEGQEFPDPPAPLPAYSVVDGWNLIGFKSTTPMTASSYLQAIEGKYTLVRGFDGSYFAVGPEEDLQPGYGYWISVIESGTIYP